MGRLKNGLPYFPLDVVLDTKFELIEAEFGLNGFGVVVKLYQKIYGQGYYIEWTDEVALLFAKKIGLGGGAVSEIVSAAIRRGIFDKNLFEKYHILTSKGVQERYFEAVSRRKQIEVDERYLLVQVAQICPNVNILKANVNINPENVDICQQSKVEKSKVKYRRGRDKPSPRPPTLEEVIAYCQECKSRIDPQRFWNHYQAQGWVMGNGAPMADWKAAVRRWDQTERPGKGSNRSAEIGINSSIDMEKVHEMLHRDSM